MLDNLVMRFAIVLSLTFALNSFAVAASGETAGLESGDRTPAMDDRQSRSVEHESIGPSDKPAFHWEAVYIHETGRNFSGGAKVGSYSLGLFALRGSLDLGRAYGIKGLSGFVHFQATHGDDPTDFAGDAQVTSSLETRATTGKLYEAWLQQESATGQASLLIGVYDLNSEFYVTDPSGLFFNSSFGIGTEIAQTTGPSIFPTPGLAVRLKAIVEESFYLQSAVFEGSPGDPAHVHGTHINYEPATEGHFMVMEAGRSIEGSKAAVGAWTYSQPSSTGNSGMYVLANADVIESISVFARYGTASSSNNRFKANFSFGVVKTGIGRRGDDQIGIGATIASNSDDFLDAMEASGTPADRDETTIEVSYALHLGNEIIIQPDLQYVMNPDTNPELENAFVGGVRVRIGLEN